ncbi:hypothetical protein, partial [Francisella philomiragia]
MNYINIFKHKHLSNLIFQQQLFICNYYFICIIYFHFYKKNTPNADPNADNLDKMAIINRLSYDNRIKILEKTLDFYDGNKTEEVLDVK